MTVFVYDLYASSLEKRARVALSLKVHTLLDSGLVRRFQTSAAVLFLVFIKPF